MACDRRILYLFQASVLEQQGKDEPFTVRTARILRCIVWFVIPITIYSILIYEAALYDPESANPVYYGGGHPLSREGFVLIKALIHSFYLYLTFNILIFSQPLESLYPQQLVLPFTLLFAQFFFVLSVAYRALPVLHDFSYACFMSLFLLWAIRDWGERNNPARQKKEVYLWLGVEVLASVVFVIFLFVPDLRVWSYQFAPKDIAVGGSVLIWFITRGFQELVKDDNYVSVYQRFKEKILLNQAPTIPSFNAEPIKHVFDFGGGDGERLRQILSWLCISPEKVVCYEKDPNWYEEFTRQAPSSTWEFVVRNSDASPPKEKIEQADLLVFSHVLYEESNVIEISKILELAKPEAVVLFRGNGPNSIFVAISFIKSRSILSTNRSHMWIDVFLKRLVNLAKLVRVNSAKGNCEPDVIVSQSYPIDAKGRILTFLRYLYDDNKGDVEIVKRFADQIHAVQNVKALPCDDVLFLYKTPAI